MEEVNINTGAPRMYVLLTVTVCLFHKEFKNQRNAYKCLIPDKYELGTWGGKIWKKGNAKWIAG